MAEASQIETILLRLGVDCRQDWTAIRPIGYDDHELPETFIQFCAAMPQHDGWPHLASWRGLTSPFGSPSALETRNQELRSEYAWPSHLIAFLETDDGVYCFDFQDGLTEPRIVYSDHWTNEVAVVGSSFIQWITEFVDWLKSKT